MKYPMKRSVIENRFLYQINPYYDYHQQKIWGFLRETREMALKAGIDKDTSLHRTGLEDYLAVIFPNINDWIYDQTTGIRIDGKKSRLRPDYRSESLKIIIEFDGLQHYTNPRNIEKDIQQTRLYLQNGGLSQDVEIIRRFSAHHKIAFIAGMTWLKQHKISWIHAAQGFSVSNILHL